MSNRNEVRLELPSSIPPQDEPLDADKRFKVLRYGRRASKTVQIIIEATRGHGPGWRENKPKYRGMLQGAHGLWLARDYKNLDFIWRRQWLSRFEGKEPLIRIDRQKRIISVKGAGSISFASNENIDSERGGFYDFVVIDEGGHFNLEYAWEEVIDPMLVDTAGWATIASTTKPGSYFNELCESIEDRSIPDAELWGTWHRTMKDNPVLPTSEVKRMLRRYKPGTTAYDCEIMALLTVKGGKAFDEIERAVHVLKIDPVPADAEWYFCMDWGYQPDIKQRGPTGWLGWGYRHANGKAFHLVGEMGFQETTPEDVGITAGMQLRRAAPGFRFGVYDSQMGALTDGPHSVIVRFQHGLRQSMGGMTPAMVPSKKGAGSRVRRVQALHDLLKFERGSRGMIAPWQRPALTMDPRCTLLWQCLRTIKKDEKNPYDVNTDDWDHPFDGFTYLTDYLGMGGADLFDQSEFRSIPVGKSPGWNLRSGKRKARQTSPDWWDALDEALPDGQRYDATHRPRYDRRG